MREKDQKRGIEILHRLFTNNQISAEELFLLSRLEDKPNNGFLDLTKPTVIGANQAIRSGDYDLDNTVPYYRNKTED